MKKLTAIILSLCIGVSVLAGCSAQTDSASQSSTESTTQTSSQESESGERTVTVTDMSGDEVTVTGNVEKIVNLWPAGTSSFIVMGAGELLSGLSMNTPTTMTAWSKYFYPDCVNIPALGGTAPSVEELVNLDPDLVIIHPSTAKDGFAQQIREVGIPAVNINFDDYESMIQAYTILGEILGGEFQEKLENWVETVKENLDKNRALTADITDEDKPVVYYIAGQGDSLVTTMGQNTIMQDWVESNGGIFASAALNLEGTEVTAEEIFKLNPDIIIVGGSYQHSLVKQLQETDGWKDLDAVKNSKVYTNPYGCFNWDRFGLESKLQLDYALMRIQPEIAAENGINEEYMVQQIIEFYEYYNGTALTEQQAQNMLNGLTPDGEVELESAQ